MSYIIAGLGNPGKEYENTRHNTGRIILELIRKSTDADFGEWNPPKADQPRTGEVKTLISVGKLGGKKMTLVEPNSFMNNSGASLRTMIASKKAAEELVVIHDDLDLPIGKFRISFNRGPGGHKGVKSIIKNIKTEAFVRVRVGISPVTPSGKIKKPAGEKEIEKFILGEFKKPELEILKKLSKKITEAIVCMVAEGREKAMNLFN